MFHHIHAMVAGLDSCARGAGGHWHILLQHKDIKSFVNW